MYYKQVEAEIRAARQDSNMSIANGNVAGVAKFWMEDIIVISGEGGQYVGKDKLLKVWRAMFKHDVPKFERLPSEVIVAASGDLAWETGIWHYSTQTSKGKYAAMWRKVNGVWKTQSELFVSLD